MLRLYDPSVRVTLAVSANPVESVITPSVIIVSPTVKSVVASTVPANNTFAPVNVAAVVEPDLIIKLPELFVNAPYCVPSSFSNTSAPVSYTHLTLPTIYSV